MTTIYGDLGELRIEVEAYELPLSDLGREYMPGRRRAWLNDVPISPERGEEIMERYREKGRELARQRRANTLASYSVEELQAELRRREEGTL